MGLLEKAEKIQTEDKVDANPTPVVASVVEPEPVKVTKKVEEKEGEKTKKDSSGKREEN